jgi:hypothetical protein
LSGPTLTQTLPCACLGQVPSTGNPSVGGQIRLSFYLRVSMSRNDTIVTPCSQDQIRSRDLVVHDEVRSLEGVGVGEGGVSAVRVGGAGTFSVV